MRWNEGPTWMYLPQEEWPSAPITFNEDEINQERRKTTISAACVELPQPHFSRYLSNVRVSAWIRRFVENTRKRVQMRKSLDENDGRKRQKRRKIDANELKQMLTSVRLDQIEVKSGERDLLYKIQQSSFDEKPVVKGYDVLFSDDGLWRLKTRITNPEYTEDFKSPIILPSKNPYVKQLLRYVHEDCRHAGVQHVLCELRERYWVIHARNAVKAIVHFCVKCQRYRVQAMSTDPAPLPQKRTRISFSFETTGVDLTGPVTLKGGQKAWIVLYTCAVYRGVVLDLVESLNTETFLMSLERFVNTMGRPTTIYSDQGTNFIGTNNLMKALDWEEVKKRSEVRRIKWIFNPPSAPSWGGWWERLIKSTKRILKSMLGQAKLSNEEMRTCLASVQNVMNERPLTTVSSDPDDLQPLTPAMFMRDLPVGHFPEGEVITARSVRKAYQKLKSLRSALQARFRKEYLGFITSKSCADSNEPPKVGCVVLVGDTNKKRYDWPLGRIIQLISGSDTKIRVAKVKTATSILERPLIRLHPLELPDPDDFIPVPVRIPHNERSKVGKVVQSPEEKTDDIDFIRTKSGRKSKKPFRYGQWNY